MQAAARKVLDENKRVLEENSRLKGLLLQMGMSESQVELSVPDELDIKPTSQQLAMPTDEQAMSLATERLEKMLVTHTTDGSRSEQSCSPPRSHRQIPITVISPQPSQQQQQQQQQAVPPPLAAPALLSPASQSALSCSLPSSSVSTPSSAFDASDDYSVLSSPEGTTAQPILQSQQQDLYGMAPMYPYQIDMEAQANLWPRTSTYQSVPFHSPQACAPTSAPSPNLLYGQDVPEAMSGAGLAEITSREQEMNALVARYNAERQLGRNWP
jgi:hypothetical protein